MSTKVTSTFSTGCVAPFLAHHEKVIIAFAKQVFKDSEIKLIKMSHPNEIVNVPNPTSIDRLESIILEAKSQVISIKEDSVDEDIIGYICKAIFQRYVELDIDPDLPPKKVIIGLHNYTFDTSNSTFSPEARLACIRWVLKVLR